MEGQPLLESDQQDDLSIPSWDNLCAHYESRWAKEKEKFQNQLKMHFKALVERFACGKQEIYSLCVADRLEKRFLNQGMLLMLATSKESPGKRSENFILPCQIITQTDYINIF